MSVSIRTFASGCNRSALVLFALLWPLVGQAAAEDDLLSLSIEDLLQVEVTSVARRSQRLADAPAAVFVLTSEDIRRSGMLYVPDLLRLVPGLHVASIDSSTWAVTARGFNGQFANKLLVMIDGRSVYTPLFSGTYWDVQDLMIEDIERIEVVRGPGGSVWGANAVNGVINIITKEASQTQGLLVSGRAGDLDRNASLRFGGTLGENTHARAYVKGLQRDDFDDLAGFDAHDGWYQIRGGMRLDSRPTERDHLTLQGDLYDGVSDLTTLTATRDDSDVRGGNLLARWTHGFEDSTDEVQLQLYYDRTERTGTLLDEVRDNFDIELQHRFVPLAGHTVVWGGGYRFTTDDIDSSSTVVFSPSSRTVHLGSLFLQYETALIENVLFLTLGSKFEYNDYTGFEIQPTGRLLWRPHERHSLWGAVSRAVRSPSRAENDVALLIPVPNPPPNFQQLRGQTSFDSEVLVAYELGYRAQPLDRVSFDIAAFYNDYDRLRSVEPTAPIVGFPAPGLVTVPALAANRLEASAWGVELSGSWEVLDFWKLTGGATFLDIEIHSSGSADPTAEGQADDSPESHFFVRSWLDLPCDLELDTTFFWVGPVDNQDVGEYGRLDVRLGWQPLPGLELSLVGQNLIDESHDEFGPSFTQLPTSVPRSFYGMATWRWRPWAK